MYRGYGVDGSDNDDDGKVRVTDGSVGALLSIVNECSRNCRSSRGDEADRVERGARGGSRIREGQVEPCRGKR